MENLNCILNYDITKSYEKLQKEHKNLQKEYEEIKNERDILQKQFVENKTSDNSCNTVNNITLLIPRGHELLNFLSDGVKSKIL